MSLVRNSLLCIASPVRRCGTTLLQRLLCSSSDTLIYGESCANDLNLLVSLYSNKEMLLKQHRNWYDEQLNGVLEGKVNDWIPDLMPEVSHYLESYKNSLFSFVDSLESFAQRNSRSICGVKLPEWNLANLLALKNTLPEIKVIYLHRNLEDCVRSAKKIDMVRGLQEIEQFCNIWKQNTANAKSHFVGDQVLHLNYEELIASPEDCISKLEQFSGAKAIDRSVMDVRINTYANDDRLDGDDAEYLKPAELTDEEKEIIQKFSPEVILS